MQAVHALKGQLNAGLFFVTQRQNIELMVSLGTVDAANSRQFDSAVKFSVGSVENE